MNILIVCHRVAEPGWRRLFPDALIMHPFDPKVGHRFDRIIWAYENRCASEAYAARVTRCVQESIRTKLKPGGDWLEITHLDRSIPPG